MHGATINVKEKALHILIFIILYARREDLLPVVMKPFVHPNSCFDALTIRHTPKHLPLSICLWPFSSSTVLLRLAQSLVLLLAVLIDLCELCGWLISVSLR